MGQLEKYGLYVLVVVIVMILGVALMGDPGTGDPEPGRSALGSAPQGDLAKADVDTLRVGSGARRGGDDTSPSDALIQGGLFDISNGPLFVDIASTAHKETPPTIPSSRDLSGGESEQPNGRIDDPAARRGKGLTPEVGTVPVVEPKPAPVENRVRQHVIAQGETASSISEKYFGTVKYARRILDANPDLDERRMRVGAEIVIPAPPQASPVAAAAPPAVVRPANARSHRVVAGDTLSSIAGAYYGHEKHWKVIQDANPQLDPQRMPVGTVVVVPPAPDGVTAAAPVRSAPAGGVLHRIEAGETLSHVSQEYYGTLHSWQRILDANPGLDARHLLVGTEIVVPGVSSRRAY